MPRTHVAADLVARPTWPAFWLAYASAAQAAYEAGAPHAWGAERDMSHADAALSRARAVSAVYAEPNGFARCNLQPADAPFTWAAARACGLPPKVRTRKGLLEFFDVMGPCTPLPSSAAVHANITKG